MEQYIPAILFFSSWTITSIAMMIAFYKLFIDGYGHPFGRHSLSMYFVSVFPLINIFIYIALSGDHSYRRATGIPDDYTHKKAPTKGRGQNTL